MKVSHGKKHLRKRGALSLLFAKNPVLVLGLDLPFIIICTTTVKIALAISAEMFMVHMVTIAVAMLTVRKFPLWLRMLINVGASFVVMTFARSVITHFLPDISNHVGMYVYLMAVNGITIHQSAQITRKDKIWPVFSHAFMNALAFSLTMLLVSIFREFLSFGTLWGIPLLETYKLSAVALPFGGFILMGFLLAITRFLNKKILAFSIAESVRQEARYMELERRAMETDSDFLHPIDFD